MEDAALLPPDEPELDHIAASRLRDLAVSPSVLVRSLETGEAERRTCSDLDPQILGGVIAWGRTMRSLREQLIPAGWESRDIRGLPLVVRPDGLFGITVATGDHRTGLLGQPPRTKYPKGVAFPVTGDRQLSLLASGDELADPSVPDDVWVVLLSRDEKEIRFELARPSHRNRDGTIGFAGERIVFPPITLTTQVVVVDEEDDDFGPEVEIERI